MSTTSAGPGHTRASDPGRPASTDSEGADTNPIPIVDAVDEGAQATVSSEASSLPRHDLPVFEAYRGIAALMVVFTHVGFDTGVGVLGVWAGWLARLDFGVTVFFLLSGFLLFRPLVQAAYGRRPPVRTGAYLRRRFVRIYPAFIVVLAFDYLLTPAARAASNSLWLETLFLIRNYTNDFVNQLPGLVQSWTLGVEVSFYLALPLLARLVLGRHTGAAAASQRLREHRAEIAAASPAQQRQALMAWRRKHWLTRILTARPWRLELAALRPGIVLGVVVALSIGWRLDYLVWHSGVGHELLWLPAFLDWFGAGMLLAWLRERDTAVPSVLRHIANSPGACWSLALAGYWLSTTKLGGPYGLQGPTTAEALLKHLIFLVIGTLVLLPAVFGDVSAAWRQIAVNRFFTWLGQISFGVFLWHPMLLEAIRRALGMTAFDGHFWVSLVLTLAASAIAGTLSWHYVEKPLQQRWRNGFRQGRRPARTTTRSGPLILRVRWARPDR